MIYKECIENIIDIPKLNRIMFDLFYHRNTSLLDTLRDSDVQIYTIGASPFACLVNSTKTIVNGIETKEYGFQFFEFARIMDHGVEKITPIKHLKFIELLDICNSEDVEGLLFHLDEIKEVYKNET